MKILNTPQSRFENLPDYPFVPNYLTVGEGLSMHYLDEGPKDGAVVLLMHGEPSWSFLYRKMIPVFVKKGYRVIVPDLIGFGKSSKPIKKADYSYAIHLEWCISFMKKLGLEDINLFCQDWGGLLGLRMLTATPQRFSRVVVANTALPTGDHPMPPAFEQWQKYSQSVPKLPIGKILQNSTVSELSPRVIAAYEAPFPNTAYQAGAKIFPSLVPTSATDPESENNRKAWEILKAWEKPFLTLFSDSDPITKGGEVPFQKLIPGAKDQPHQIIKGGGHFLQEDKGEEIAAIMIEFMENS